MNTQLEYYRLRMRQKELMAEVENDRMAHDMAPKSPRQKSEWLAKVRHMLTWRPSRRTEGQPTLGERSIQA